MNLENLKNDDLGEDVSPERIKIKALEPLMLFVLLLLTWSFLPQWLQGDNQTVGIVDQSMWVLLVLGVLGFLMTCAVSWWLLKHFWLMLGLPDLIEMVSQFKTLELWQQLSFFLASFVSLLLAATGCLMAVC